MNLKIIAPAKINLGLEIGSKNSEGYHEMDMAMQSISLYDEIEIGNSADSGINLSIDKNLNCSIEKNIAYKTAKEFFNYTKIKNKGINVNIKKSIPMCAGLAGGSADGAGVIVGLNKLFDTNLGSKQMCEIGQKVGSDIPFCIMGGTAHAFGIGTNLSSLNPVPQCNIIVVKPDISISTAKAFSDFDSMPINRKHNLSALISACENRDLLGICKNLFNRFEEVINEPEISKIKTQLINCGALNSLMTGSGSAVYGIFNDPQKAEKCIEKLKAEYPYTFLCKPINHGAKIL